VKEDVLVWCLFGGFGCGGGFQRFMAKAGGGGGGGVYSFRRGGV